MLDLSEFLGGNAKIQQIGEGDSSRPLRAAV